MGNLREDVLAVLTSDLPNRDKIAATYSLCDKSPDHSQATNFAAQWAESEDKTGEDAVRIMKEAFVYMLELESEINYLKNH